MNSGGSVMVKNNIVPIAKGHRGRPGFTFTTDFAIFALVNSLAAWVAPILDCDEVFNYWEPMHYLNHGFGLQTWEYSPEYAIRSWFYILVHALPAKVMTFWADNGSVEFYVTRLTLAIACAYCQTRLFAVVAQEYGRKVARIFQLAMISSSGMFYASVAFLPSSFAMMANMMGTASFLDLSSGLQTRHGVFWFGMGAAIGWPFSAALAAPLMFDELASIPLNGFGKAFRRTLDGCIWVLGAIVSQALGSVLRL